MSKEIVVEFNSEELGDCRIYQRNIMGYEQAIKDLKRHKANQTKQITNLETELADAEEHIDNLELQLREQYQLVDEKDEEIELLEKALDLASKQALSIYCSDYCGEFSCIDCHYKNLINPNQFKEQAKEMMKSE